MSREIVWLGGGPDKVAPGERAKRAGFGRPLSKRLYAGHEHGVDVVHVDVDEVAELVDVFEHDGDGHQDDEGQDTACVRGWGARPRTRAGVPRSQSLLENSRRAAAFTSPWFVDDLRDPWQSLWIEARDGHVRSGIGSHQHPAPCFVKT